MIKTERMRLIALTADQLWRLVEDLPAFEAEFGYAYRGEELTGALREIFMRQIPVVRAANEAYAFCTFWMMVHLQDGAIVGSFTFKALPDEAGDVEIGYGVAPEYERKGLATEAVRAAIGWALCQPGVHRVIAEVEKANIASQRVLKKCGMAYYKEAGECDWYSIGPQTGTFT